MHRVRNFAGFRSRPGRVRRARVILGGVAFLGALAALAPSVRPNTGERPFLTAKVRSADFSSLIVASGRVESTNSTEIRCDLERLSSATAPTILWLVEDGTTVSRNAVLAELDSSGYRELVRQQDITLQQVRASHLQSELDLEVSLIGLEAFKLGEMLETDRLYRSQIALGESDVNRQTDRLGWTRKMVIKGYASALQVATDRQTMQLATFTLRQTRTAFRNYLRFTAPKTIKALESQVNSARATLDYQTVRLRREEERMVLYQKMVDSCTVRAPHDGFVIYANQPGRAIEIYEGAPVRQRQRLFTLPDLSEMEVQALLHETVVNRVAVGMPVRARLEALPGLQLEGVVVSVSPFPLNARKSESGSDVTYFLGKVLLTKVPAGLRPGMSAELEITTTRRENVLAVPHTALNRDGDLQVCTVLRGVHLERRVVTVGAASHDLIEVTAGLADGEIVLLDHEQTAPAPPAEGPRPHGPGKQSGPR